MSLSEALRNQDYPCRYPFKLVLKPDAVDEVERRIKAVCKPAQRLSIKLRQSRNGRYVALTASIEADRAETIETVYAALADAPGIVTSL